MATGALDSFLRLVRHRVAQTLRYLGLADSLAVMTIVFLVGLFSYFDGQGVLLRISKPNMVAIPSDKLADVSSKAAVLQKKD